MKTILVSGATGVVGYSCLRSLRKDNQLNLIGTSIYDNLIPYTFCDYFELAEHTDSPLYLDWLLNIINKHQVDLLIPGIEIDMFFWNKHRTDIENTGTKLMLNSPSLIELCEDKWNFYKVLSVSCPSLAIPSYINHDYEFLCQSFGSPFLLKPRKGFGSKGIVTIHDQSEFNFYDSLSKIPRMAQKLLYGEEYTIGAFYDHASQLCSHISMKRTLASGGFTESATVVDIEEMADILSILGNIYKPVGATNLQFIKTEEGFKLLEINPRISSSTSIRTAFHYNECLMSVEYYLNGQIPLPDQILKGTATRYIEDIIKYDWTDL